MKNRYTHLLLTGAFWLVCISMANATKVLITETRTPDAPTQFMDLNWKRASNLAGFDNEIIPYTNLDSLHILQEADVLIIASGISGISGSQRSVILEFIANGGHVYVQSEFRINFTGNQLYEYLVNKSGGTFAWEGETDGNLNPVSIPNYVQDDNSPAGLNYFWNGTYGCGEDQIFPLISYMDKDYGFLFAPDDNSTGRIMTTSDQDWIKIATEVGQEHRLQFMRVLLESLANGIDNLIIPDIRISFLQQSICAGSPFDVEANIDETILEHQVEWFKNGIASKEWLDKKSFETTDLDEGDILQANITVHMGCEPKVIASNFVEIERSYPLSMNSVSILGSSQICNGEPAVFVADIASDAELSMVNFTWKVNGEDQEVNDDTLVLEQPIDESVISLSLVYDNMCEMVTIEADNTLTIETIGEPIPNLILNQNKSTYCERDQAVIEIQGTPDLDHTIVWHVNNQAVETSDNSATYTLNALTNDHEVYAIVTYSDACKGIIKLSTPVASITIDEPKLQIIEKENTSCDMANGSILLEVEGGTAPYSYTWNGTVVDNPTTNLPTGRHTINVADVNGCTSEISTSIGESDPRIIDSLVVEDPSCNTTGLALVKLYTNSTITDELEILWLDENDSAVNLDFQEGEFEPGKYQVTASLNENCSETRAFEIASGGIEDNIKRSFDTEAEFFLTLDLGISPSDIQSISWNDPEDRLDCKDCTWPALLATKSETFTVDIVTVAGCAFQADIRVNVSEVIKPPYFAPSGFSPDGNGENDFYEFYVDSSEAQLLELLIFDRWGNLVYLAKDSDTVQWDGTINGKPGDKGVYAYAAKLKKTSGEDLMVSGSIMLIR